MVRRKRVAASKKKITETNDLKIPDYPTEQPKEHETNMISAGNKHRSKENYADLSVIEESVHNYVEDLLKSENSDKQKLIPIRAKQIDNRRSAGENPKTQKKRKLNREMGILREIKKYQKSTELLIPRAPFARVCKEIFCQYGNRELRVAKMALECLQEAAEIYLIELFEDAYLCTAHANRKTLAAKDLRLARRIGGRGGFYL